MVDAQLERDAAGPVKKEPLAAMATNCSLGSEFGVKSIITVSCYN